MAPAVRATVRRLTETSRFARSRSRASLIVGTRHEAPLVVGLGEGENFIASAIPAFLAHTRRVSCSTTARSSSLRADGAESPTSPAACRARETRSPGTPTPPRRAATRTSCSRRSTSSRRRSPTRSPGGSATTAASTSTRSSLDDDLCAACAAC